MVAGNVVCYEPSGLGEDAYSRGFRGYFRRIFGSISLLLRQPHTYNFNQAFYVGQEDSVAVYEGSLRGERP
jgi:hypothetical protein